MTNNDFIKIKIDFEKNGISSICYLMCKFKINHKLAKKYINKLSVKFGYDAFEKNGKIVINNFNEEK